mgnify:CR=1 FL=1
MNNLKAKFILKNFIKVLLLLFAVSVAAFALMTASPIDPLKANVGQAALGSMSQEQIVKLEEYWGVGQPPLQRYIAWFRDFVRGDMGISPLSPESYDSDRGKTWKFFVPDDHCVGFVRTDRIFAGFTCRYESWKAD